MNIRALVAELVGTFILIFMGSLGIMTLAIITNGQGSPQFALLVIPWSFGLGLLAAIAIGGHASGGHFNPAVTLAALLDRRVTWQSAIGYVIAQLIGGFAASLLVRLMTTIGMVAATVNQPGPASDELQALVVEVALTAIFVAVILTVTNKSPQQAILVIPLTLVAIHIVGMTISGASVNPVRSLAPAAVSGTYQSLWIYLIGPMVGSLIGWAAYYFLTPPDDEVSVEVEEDFEDDLESDFDDED